MKNIVLIGMPASGKSTAGALLAQRMGLGFLDCDLLIQGEEQKLLSELIEERGAEGFLQTEERILAGLICSRCVIATGGSAIYSARAMEHLKSMGIAVYLKIGAEEMKKRIPDFALRGVVMRKGVGSLDELFLEREPLYELYADIIVDCARLNVQQTVEAIFRAVEK